MFGHVYIVTRHSLHYGRRFRCVPLSHCLFGGIDLHCWVYVWTSELTRRLLIRTGIGAASARAFAISGVFKMSLVDIDRDALQSITSSLLGDFPGIDVLALPTDITDEKSVGNAVRETIARFSRIDYAVHAAGVGDVQLATDEIPVPEWQKMIDINLTGTWICERSVIQAMLQQEYALRWILLLCLYSKIRIFFPYNSLTS